MVEWSIESYSGTEISKIAGGTLIEEISMTHSGMLYRLNIFTFNFYEGLLFQIFIPWKFIKN